MEASWTTLFDACYQKPSSCGSNIVMIKLQIVSVGGAALCAQLTAQRVVGSPKMCSKLLCTRHQPIKTKVSRQRHVKLATVECLPTFLAVENNCSQSQKNGYISMYCRFGTDYTGTARPLGDGAGERHQRLRRRWRRLHSTLYSSEQPKDQKKRHRSCYI